MAEDSRQFESRKKDHIRLALDGRSQTLGQSGLERIELVHEALPEIDFQEVDTKSDFWGHSVRMPLFISSMTAGHAEGVDLNARLAASAQSMGWAMGVGSQRRELNDPSAVREWVRIRKLAPDAVLFGNLGISQLIQATPDQVQRLVDGLQASALFVHTNPLQEVLQPEGTPSFRGGLERLRSLCRVLSVPVILKEVGCGFSALTLNRLQDLGLAAVDLAGKGGTHWGRLEGLRSQPGSLLELSAQTFADWGQSTLDSLLAARREKRTYEVWASGGVRDGHQAAKLLCLGARKVGIAQPLLRAALESDQALGECMQRFELELKIAMFCTGSKNLTDLQREGIWTWR